MDATLKEPKKNLICNFRAPTVEQWQDWQDFKAWCQDNGYDVCHMNLSLIKSFIHGTKAAAQIVKTPQQIVNLQLNPTFQYQVQRPRREPFGLNCIKSEYRRSFSSILYEAYVRDKARRLNTEFSFRDFLEMDDRAFHRIVRRLIRKGEVVANPRRSVPRTYFLTEKLAEYGYKKI